ncbi:MAG: aminodeoxychorismate lyase [Candidatus Polarisedimenticolaceae bacterium]|nr:aminodeoxychorismate lyase [Candidatus Polarisedimenticolaceae bacterium]
MNLLINGKQTDQLSVLDRGIQYGDGLFETIAVIDGRLSLWERHVQRLLSGCKRLGITAPEPAGLLAEAEALISHQQRAVLKIVVTRGIGGRGYRPSKDLQPSRVLYCTPWPDYPEECRKKGILMRLCATGLGINPALAQLKHLNRLEQVVARSEWSDPAIFEGLMLDSDGRVIEGTMSNLFLIKKGLLITPDLQRCGVAGVMRGLIIELAAKLNIPVLIESVSLDDVKSADALFISNSLIGILPVKAFSSQSYCLELIPPELVRAVDRVMSGGS